MLGVAVGDDGYDVGGFQGAPEGAEQGFVANKAGALADLAAALVYELQGDGLDGGLGFDGCFQQIAVKMEQINPVSSRSFGENRQNVAVGQRLAHVVDDAHGVAAGLALDVERAAGGGQGAENGPVFDVGFGHKAAMPRGVHDQNIQPGDVVGHQKHRSGAGWRAFYY